MISVSSFIRKLVAYISLNNLKEYLSKSVSILPEDSNLKSIIVHEIINKKNLTEEDLKPPLAKLKAIIKGYDLSVREPFKKTILQPIQNALDKNKFFDPTNFNNVIRDQKAILNKKEKELSKSKKVIQDVSTIPFPKVLANR